MLSPLLSDGMVLQRGPDVKVSGRGAPECEVTVTFMGRECKARAGTDGAWTVDLGACGAGGPYEMAVRCGAEETVIKDVLVGDVWLCAGQSNMELPMSRVRHMFPEELELAGNPDIRHFKVPQIYDFQGPRDTLSGGRWEHMSPQTIGEFPAVGWFFAKRLYERYGVPVGLIAAAVGGTPICAWMERSTLTPPDAEEAAKWAVPGAAESVIREEQARSAAYYRMFDGADIGLREGWQAPDFDDGGWPERALDLPWDSEMKKPGAIWFRRTFDIPRELDGKPYTVFLGTLTDADDVYIDGLNIGGTAYQYPPRVYGAGALKRGRHVIAVRVRNYYGKGGFVRGKPRVLACGGRGLDLNGLWRYQRGCTTTPHIGETFFNYKPSGMYNGMIAPLAGHDIKGAIWYQGESDTGNPGGYPAKFAAMVNSWRKLWGRDFPVLSAQLTHYSDPDGGAGHAAEWEAFRKCQTETLSVPNTGMIFTYDAGEDNDLHPLNKQAIGDRFARAAMCLAYGDDAPHSPFHIVPM